MYKEKLLQNAEMIYKEIAEKDKMLCKDFLSISLETIGKPCNLSFPQSLSGNPEGVAVKKEMNLSTRKPIRSRLKG